MKHRVSDEQLRDYIDRMDNARLGQWLLEQCQDNALLRSSLLDLVVPKDAVQPLVDEIVLRITAAWGRVHQGRAYWQAVPLSMELDGILQSIEGLIEKGCFEAAEKLLVHFIRASETYGMEVDDSHGQLWPVCRRGVALWGKVWARINPADKISLADRVYVQIGTNDNGLKDDIVDDFKEALGIPGLHYL